ncbi:hypothetical protein LEP1GSC202_2757 [Leptospira yanagawae serovar Saopaulo str. Sao Paulo = ATCC 700523]|uniref:Uncharacterized protein n=1 Tax=Leptospira yanagawae serovar Saopaulo str. Sao Paulo = ATCC 700523 TaxID=1249483 RepID=A0A5E8HBR6_9LEPT|nr:hypothetical protein LEP1GSC202_2757 [Leptospira yanagawae serovar Saopaulo str. Sao Paulo = ATCC 700523]
MSFALTPEDFESSPMFKSLPPKNFLKKNIKKGKKNEIAY